MKIILPGLFLLIFMNGLSAQDADSLQGRSVYQRAWDTAMLDGRISHEERAIMNSLVRSLMLAVDSSHIWETQWKINNLDVLDQSGRWTLVLQNIVIGAGVYGWTIPYVLQAENSRWYIGSEMIATGGAFYLTHQYTKKMQMSHARTQMMRYGELLGLRYGLGINEILDLVNQDGSKRKTLWAWILMASVPAGHLGGEYLYNRFDPSNGQAWAWTMWTGAAGLSARLVHSVIDPEPRYLLEYNEAFEEQYRQDKAAWKKRKTITELIAYPIGAVGGYYLIRDKQYSFGDAMMLIQGWGFGFYNTMMLQGILNEDADEEVLFMLASLGGMGSSILYDQWIAPDDFTFGQASLMLLGSTSGIAFGYGTGILLDIKDTKPLLTLGLIGYGAGTYLTRSILKVKSGGSLSRVFRNTSLTPTVLPIMDVNRKVTLIPALNLRVNFK